MTKENLRFVHHQLRALDAEFDQRMAGQTACDHMVTVRNLCWSLFKAVDDNYCREQLDLIELYAADLFSEGRQNRQLQPQPSIYTLKQKIRKCLDTIEARLRAVERADVV
jgi:hypothetical protein